MITGVRPNCTTITSRATRAHTAKRGRGSVRVQAAADNMKVGFMGMGIMGAPMAANLVKAGVDVTVWNRDASKVGSA